jgi:hypothetical protein
MDENWPDWSNFRHIILTWYKEPYKTKKLEKNLISQIGLKSAYSQFPSSVDPPNWLRNSLGIKVCFFEIVFEPVLVG